MGMLVACPQCGSVHYTQSAMECQCDGVIGTFTCDDCGTDFEVTYMVEKARRIETCWTVTDSYSGLIVVVAKTLRSAIGYLIKIGEIDLDTEITITGHEDDFCTLGAYLETPEWDEMDIQNLVGCIQDGEIDIGFQFQKMEIWDS